MVQGDLASYRENIDYQSTVTKNRIFCIFDAVSYRKKWVIWRSVFNFLFF